MISCSPTFHLADPLRDRDALLALNIEYMHWNDLEFKSAFGRSVAEMVGMPIPAYVTSVIDKVCGERPPRGAFYLVMDGAQVMGMGGLRQVRPGLGELKRMYVRPGCRGQGLGAAILQRLLADAAAFGFGTLLLDSAPYMPTAHRLYEAVGFVDRAPYPETEVPPELHARWRFMERIASPAC